MVSKQHSRRSFLKVLAAGTLTAPLFTSDLLARPPMNRLRHASMGASGMAWGGLSRIASHKDVDLIAVADVDLSRTGMVKKKFPQARIYQDWRELFEKEGRNLDSVNVGTPDHMHAPIAMSAMQLGKHVYVEKPMAHDIHEVRALTSFARAKKLVSQMGIQIHSNVHYRMAVVLMQSGIIGRIKEVHSWVPKSWGDPNALPDRRDQVPDGFDWDSWLGVSQFRPFIGGEYYHPSHWRSRLDFGTGTLGDMGCHIFDPVFNALKLLPPTLVRSEGPAPNKWNWAINSRIHYTFKGTRFTAGDTLALTWYDGDQKPPAEVVKLLEGDPLPNAGSIIVGTQGTMLLPHINRPMLYPDAKFQAYPLPEVGEEDHYWKFVDACLGRTQTTAGFNYSGPLTEAVLLGTVATRFPQTTLQWNSAAMSFGSNEADQYLSRSYRDGWDIKGLS